MYFIKTPGWVKRVFSAYTWHVPTEQKELYLTFDDGPHSVATPFVLNQLDQYNAKATFFCLGKNVIDYPGIFADIIEKGHSVGNHTHNHLNGWKVQESAYLANVEQAAQHIDSDLFRPPYGRLKTRTGRSLVKAGYQVIMWDVLSGDFDLKISAQKCSDNVLTRARQGSIIVFHDSQKALAHLQYALPRALEYFATLGFSFKRLENNRLNKKGPG
ncbi:polysaccharide deacetylase family protein [Niabella insulamsoli]|uniref:polysaccharide deacetylase family protein n=1 Tax=Niabella insulamsoli TaxID=3144874 RepID=UPI0031FC97D1